MILRPTGTEGTAVDTLLAMADRIPDGIRDHAGIMMFQDTLLAMADRIPDGIRHHAGIMMFQPKSLQHCKELLWYYGDRYERGMRDIQATRPVSIDRLKAQGIGTCPPLRRASRYLGESYNY